MKKDWKKLFSPIILARGKEYYETGAVQDLTVSDEEILARVEGSESYEVEIELRGDTVANMDCTCPYAEDHDACKHMVAVLYKWESQKEAPALSAETERFVRNLSAEQAKNLLLAHAQTCASLREILFELSEEKKTGKKRSAWKKELAAIRRRYSCDGYIDYRGAYDYFTECVDFLDEKIDPLIENKHLKEAFTVCCDIYKTATDVETIRTAAWEYSQTRFWKKRTISFWKLTHPCEHSCTLTFGKCAEMTFPPKTIPRQKNSF